MRKNILLFFLCNLFISVLYAQVLCVQCFNQNDSLGVNVGSNNKIINGGFENSTCGLNCSGIFCPNALSGNCSISNWVCTGGGQLTYSCLYDSSNNMVAEGARAAYFGNSYANACSGNSSGTFPNNDTICLNYSGCTVTGIPAGYPISGNDYGGVTGLSLSQTVTGLTPGNIYVLEFWAGGEYQGWFSKDGMFAVDVGFGKIFLTCKITHQPPDVGTRYVIQFIAGASSQNIIFTNWGHICGTCTELVLDDVRLYPITFLTDSVPDCFVGLSEINETRINYFPNPAHSFFNISIGRNEKLDILNSFGMKVFEKKYSNMSEEVIELDVSILPAGLYFIVAGNTVRKFIKE